MFSESSREDRASRLTKVRRAVLGLQRFKIEASSVLLASGIAVYSAIYGAPYPDPKFTISYSCVDNKLQYNRRPGKHVEITVESDFRHESGSLAIYWTPQRLRRYNPQLPFPRSVTESLEVPNGFSYPEGGTTLVMVLFSPSPDANHAINGRMVASALVPSTC